MKHVKTSNKELNKLLKKAEQQNWRVLPHKRGGHIKCYSPDKKTIVVIATSTKSLRAIENSKACFKKGGLVL